MIENFLFNPHGQDYQAHSATLCEHKNDIFCSWYVYPEKEHIDGKIVIAHYNRSRSTWLPSKIVTNFSGSFGNPVLYSDGKDLYLFYVSITNYWDDAQIFSMKCLNLDTFTWEQAKKVNTPEGVMIRHRPLKMSSKTLIPAYDENNMTSVIYEIEAEVNKWKELSHIEGHFIQGDLVKLSDNEIQIFMRAAKDNENVFRALSNNESQSWYPPIKTPLPCPLSGIAALKGSDNTIALCYNHTLKHKRTPISLNLSLNSGTNFYKSAFDIERADTELSYPNMLLDSNNDIHIVYTYARKKIKHILTSFEEVQKRLEEINAQ